MPDWSVIETQLSTWVNNVTGLPVYWQDRPSTDAVTGNTGVPFNDNGRCMLSISAPVTVGRDMLAHTYDSTQPARSQMRVYQEGARTFTFSVQVRTYRQTVDLDAKHYTSLLRDRVDLPTTSTALFDVADIAYARILGEADTETVNAAGRKMSVAQIDFRFNATSTVEDTAIDWIETITDADLEIPEGTVVDTSDYTVG